MEKRMLVLVSVAVAVGFGSVGCDEGIYGGADTNANGDAFDSVYDGLCHFEIANATGETILGMYLADASAADWGEDVLEEDVLWDGDVMTGYLRPNPGSSYDLKAVTGSGTIEVDGFFSCENGEELSFEIAPASGAGKCTGETCEEG